MPKKCWAYRNGRPGVEVIFHAPNGQQVTKILMADTGALLHFVLDGENLERLKLLRAPFADGGAWGILEAGWVYASIPDLQTELGVIAYSSDLLTQTVASEGFDGIAGLEFLDRFKYSGDGEQFCLQTKRTKQRLGQR